MPKLKDLPPEDKREESQSEDVRPYDSERWWNAAGELPEASFHDEKDGAFYNRLTWGPVPRVDGDYPDGRSKRLDPGLFRENPYENPPEEQAHPDAASGQPKMPPPWAADSMRRPPEL